MSHTIADEVLDRLAEHALRESRSCFEFSSHADDAVADDPAKRALHRANEELPDGMRYLRYEPERDDDALAGLVPFDDWVRSRGGEQ